MKTFFKWLLLAPVAIVLVVFSVANRQNVQVVLDPIGLLGDGMTISAPLFVVLFLALMAGVVAGGAASWLAQGKHRRAAREARSDARALREEVRLQHEETDRLRSQFAALPPPAAGSQAVARREAA